MHVHFRLGKHNIYPWLFIACAAVAYMAVYLLVPEAKAPELYLSVTGAVAGFVYFLYSQHHQKTQLFVTLFEKFNARYDSLNEKLNAIVIVQDEELTKNEKQAVLFAYFNLCAEEYLFYKSGYIDQDVWLSWIAGMKYFAQNNAIRSLWESELRSESYYGFSLALFHAVP
jgi:hypothetical protein